MIIANSVDIELDAREMVKDAKFRRLNESDVVPLIEQSRQLIKPQALMKFTKVASIDADRVVLEEGQNLISIILSDTLQRGQTIVPYVLTLGSELENQASEIAKESILGGWILETIGDYALGKASSYIKSKVEKELGASVSSFCPGTGTGKLFGIEQQRVLFEILDPPENIGVHLTPSYLMVPRKSVSGIFAPTSQEYVACQYCPRKCENRRRPFLGEYVALDCRQNRKQ